MIPIRDHNPRAGAVWVVWTLAAAAALAFVVPIALGGLEGVARVAWAGGLVPVAWWADPSGQAPRLLAHAFLHGGWAHLVGNLVFLVVFGDNVEDHLGHARFLAFYVAAAVVAGLAHAVAAPASPLPLVGASGAISALLGAYVRFFPRRRVDALVVPLVLPWLVLRTFARTPAFFVWPLPAWLYLGYWALLQVVEGMASLETVQVAATTGGVAWWAHVGGFVFGVVATPL
ncbi:MAG: rhomboid family intramembrane serine protease, partial [Trueperaceae bacterium]|nr:rhomboid family intramembrane serine protease [Trueperaceae bacterium]